MNKFIGSFKFVAFGLIGIIFLTSPSILLSQQKVMGELTVLGGANGGEASFVTINGELAVTGGTVMSPAEIATAPQTGAKITIGKTGRVEFGPNSRMTLTFDENRIGGVFTQGLLTIAVAPQTSFSVQTADGVVTNPNLNLENVVIIELTNGKKTRVTAVTGAAAFNGTLIPAGQVGGVGGGVAASTGGSIFSASIPLYAALAAVVGAVVITAVVVGNSNEEEVVSPMR